jgi:hypothetical protein
VFYIDSLKPIADTVVTKGNGPDSRELVSQNQGKDAVASEIALGATI